MTTTPLAIADEDGDGDVDKSQPTSHETLRVEASWSDPNNELAALMDGSSVTYLPSASQVQELAASRPVVSHFSMGRKFSDLWVRLERTTER